MRLAHIHIPGLIAYSHSLRLQNAIIERQFRYKDWLRATGSNDAPAQSSNSGVEAARQHAGRRKSRATADSLTRDDRVRPSFANISSRLSLPDPVVLTFSTYPTYTVGRRHLQTNPISPSQQEFLSSNGLATFYASSRGGLLTYHAPGQLTAYVIADLRRHGITARCWVKLLEESVMRTCGVWGVRTGRTDDPGVWVMAAPNMHTPAWTSISNGASALKPLATDRKICAIGVQVSRGITSHGVGLNVHDAQPSHVSTCLSESSPIGNTAFTFTPAQTASPSCDAVTRGYLSWGFSRIVACGLEGKSVTWLTREMTPSQNAITPASHEPPRAATGQCLSNSKATSPSGSIANPPPQPDERAVAAAFVAEVMHGLNTMKGADKESVDEVYTIHQEDILR
jgi:lipoate-protein ligase B